MNDEPLNLDEMFRLMADIQRLRREQEQAMAHDEGIPRRAEEIEREARIEAANEANGTGGPAEFQHIYQIAEERQVREETAEERRQRQFTPPNIPRTDEERFVNNFFHNEPIPRALTPRELIEEARRQRDIARRQQMPAVQPPPRGTWWDEPVNPIPVPPQPHQVIMTTPPDPWDEVETIGAGNPRGLGNHPERVINHGNLTDTWQPLEPYVPPAEPENIIGKPEDHFL